jgi:hypothetical protein
MSPRASALSLLASCSLFLVACASPVRPSVSPGALPAPAPTAAAPVPEATRVSYAGLGALLNPVEESRPPAIQLADEPAPPSVWTGVGAGRAQPPRAFGAGDRAAIARALCGSSPVSGGSAGPRCACPADAELPDGELTFSAMYAGHFSGPGRDEVVVETQGCVTGASSSQSYGGRAIVRRGASGWTRVFNEPGALGDCSTLLSHAGRSRLLCRRTAGHMGLLVTGVTLVAFDEESGAAVDRSHQVLELLVHTDGPPTPPAGPVYSSEIGRFVLRGQAAFEAGDDRALSLDLVVKSRASCTGGAAVCAPIDTAPLDLPLRFVFDGEAFHPAAESRPALARLAARSVE